MTDHKSFPIKITSKNKKIHKKKSHFYPLLDFLSSFKSSLIWKQDKGPRKGLIQDHKNSQL